METPPKLSSYQKMKQKYEKEIQSLHSDIRILVEDKDLMMQIIIKARWQMFFDADRMLTNGESYTSADGIFSLIKE